MGKGIAVAATVAAVLLATAGRANGDRANGPITRCDPLAPAACLLPWPNDRFRVHGRLALRPEQMPRDRDGEPIAPSDYNRSDGFSPGQIIVTRVPGLDTPAAFRRTGAVPLTDMGRYRARRAPIVVIDARTGRRHPIWAELDMRAPQRSRALLIHPSLSWREGHRYVVALRRLRDARGRLLHPRRAFRIYRDRRRSRSPDV